MWAQLRAPDPWVSFCSQNVKTPKKAHMKKTSRTSAEAWCAGGQVASVDVGSAVPLIHNLRTLPTPTATIWPQVMFDLHYTGVPHTIFL